MPVALQAGLRGNDKAATKIIPVAFASSSDPVAVGLVTNLTRPGANVTGVSILNQE